ncbi:MAG: thiol:disulfide interchange protein DsbA/DsbL [Pseudomonadales bacterium]|jgi:thiol:disulfide interchange protein DsbA|nr:thiol:disulfide interchange protein DsbA/DsbL [Pseudomonadales bacterium]
MKSLLKPFLALALLCISATSAFAQPAAYVEGTHYQLIEPAVRTEDPSKIEVTEVFWYGCPHCYAFEPLLESWVEKLPEDVAFVRSPGMWNALMETHAKIYYTAVDLGVFDKIHSVAFNEIHQKGNYLQTEDDIRTMFVAQGVDPAAFDKSWSSFGVTSAAKKAGTRMREYKVNGVPNLIVNGKYLISAGDAVVTQADMLKVADFLIEQERRNN